MLSHYLQCLLATGSTQRLRIKSGEEINRQRFGGVTELRFAQRWRALQQDEAQMASTRFGEAG